MSTESEKAIARLRDGINQSLPRAIVTTRLGTIAAILETAERDMALMKTQVRVSDEAFNFHMKRANDLMNLVDPIQTKLAESEAACAKKDTALRTIRPSASEFHAEIIDAALQPEKP